MRTVGHAGRASFCGQCGAICPNSWSKVDGYVHANKRIYCNENCERLQVFAELRRLTEPLIEAYHDDLLVHDRKMIVEDYAGGTPFLHYTRKCGTHLFMLPAASVYPRKGERVPFLFGTASREELLQGVGDCVRSLWRSQERGDRPQEAVYHFDGEIFHQIDESKAMRICDRYRYEISTAWAEVARDFELVPC